jgi:hypothetical protein
MHLLRYNTTLLHGAFAVENIEGRDMIVLQANVLTNALSALDVPRILNALAWQADKVEETLLGQQDQH